MRIVVLSLPLLLVACSPTGPPGELEARTDRAEYSAGDKFTLRIVNNSERGAWFPHCGDRLSFEVEQRIAGVWRDSGYGRGRVCIAILSSGNTVLPAGKSYVLHSTIHQSDTHPGLYRLKFPAGTSPERVGSLSLYSNEFVIRQSAASHR